MPFWSRKQEDPTPTNAADQLTEAVRRELGDADDTTVRIVAAVAGLVAAVVYADRVIADQEIAVARQALSRIPGLTPQAVNVICGVLTRNVSELSAVHANRFTRELKELTEARVRLEVLDLLVDLAASDGEIATTEVNRLRQLTQALGLTQADYNASQGRHRDKLASMKAP